MLQYHEKKIIFLTGGVLVALFILIFLFIIPVINRIYKLNNDIFQIQHDLELRYEKSNNLRKSKINLGKVKQLTSSLNTLFITKNDELDFIVFLEQTARANHLEQNILLLGKQPTKKEGPTPLNTQIQVTGQFENVIAFLLDIENAQLAIKLSSISIMQGGPSSISAPLSSSKNLVTLSAEATAYVNP